MNLPTLTRFPRTTHLLKGDAWDLAPFLCVLFPLALFLVFQNILVRPQGSLLTLPTLGTNAAIIPPGSPLLMVAVDAALRAANHFSPNLPAPLVPPPAHRLV